jgi:hypothetical protein
MLTYQLQTRIIRFKGEDGPLTFPNRVEIELRLGPATAFGTEASPSRTVVRARAAGVKINANTGRWLALSDLHWKHSTLHANGRTPRCH